MWQWRFRILFKTTQICFTVMLWINALGVYKIFRAGGRGVLSRGTFISYHEKWQKHDNKWVILGSWITVSFIKKTKIRISITENQQHYRDLHNCRPLKLVMSCQIWKVWWQDGLPFERENIAPVLKIKRFRCWTMVVKTTRKTFRKTTCPLLKLLLYYFDRLSVVWHSVTSSGGL